MVRNKFRSDDDDVKTAASEYLTSRIISLLSTDRFQFILNETMQLFITTVERVAT